MWEVLPRDLPRISKARISLLIDNLDLALGSSPSSKEMSQATYNYMSR
jgi:hypothetical protein